MNVYRNAQTINSFLLINVWLLVRLVIISQTFLHPLNANLVINHANHAMQAQNLVVLNASLTKS
jgi:hypothetical protein